MYDSQGVRGTRQRLTAARSNWEKRYLAAVVLKRVSFMSAFKFPFHSVLIKTGGVYTSGAPNKNIVQNHLNIALLNVFKYLDGRYRHIFIP